MPRIKGTPSIRGREKLECLKLLAEGQMSQHNIAEKFGRSRTAITTFAKRNADLIQEMRENAESEFVGLWIAKKVNRVAEYESDVERINEWHDAAEDGELDSALLARKQTALKSVAEELGQLVQKQDNTSRVEYKISTEDLEDLT